MALFIAVLSVLSHALAPHQTGPSSRRAVLSKAVAGFTTVAAVAAVGGTDSAAADEIGVSRSEKLSKNQGALCIKRSAINGRCEVYGDDSGAPTIEPASRQATVSGCHDSASSNAMEITATVSARIRFLSPLNSQHAYH